MVQHFKIGCFALIGGLALPALVSAQVVIRAPFVRVETGGPGTYVRAPFVNLYIPSGPPVVYVPAPNGAPNMAPSGAQILPAPRIAPEPQPQPLPPNPQDPNAPPQPVQTQHPTLDQFARNFQPKAGSYEVTIMNPLSGQPNAVRFVLPDGNPRVSWSRQDIRYEYGPRQFVRIEFDRDGAQVVSR